MRYGLPLLIWLAAGLGSVQASDQVPAKAQPPPASAPDQSGAAGADDHAHLAKLARIHELFELTNADKLMTQVMGQVNSLMEKRLRAVEGFDQAVFDRAAVLEKADISVALDKMAVLYDKHFTEDDVKAIVAFYQTDAGKHYQAFVAKAMAPLMQASMEWFMAERKRLMKEIDAGAVTQEGPAPAFGSQSANGSDVRAPAGATAAPDAQAAGAGDAERAAKLADVRAFRALIQEDSQVEDAMVRFVDTLKAQKADEPLGDEFWAALGKQANGDIRTLDDRLEKLYFDDLTHDDIRCLIAFNKTASGQHLRGELPLLLKEYALVMKDWTGEIFERAKQRVSSAQGAADPAGVANEPENGAPPALGKPARNGTD